MKLRVAYIVVFLITLVLTASLSLTAARSTTPSISNEYKLYASSPSDDPSTDVIEVNPGQSITVEAVATLTYSGTAMISPVITVTNDMNLLNGNISKAHVRQSVEIDPIQLEDGHTYTRSGNGSITVPDDTKPGIYTLVCVAAATSGDYSKRTAEKFQVKVISKSESVEKTIWYNTPPSEKPIHYISRKMSWSH
ncbi:MAG TPA: hypothetical protein VK436_07220 [Methanocella sp.]|nr:hypothetical protein [Methanocella sp.]